MFGGVVTLFNHDEETGEYYPALFTNVEFQAHYRTSFSDNSTRDGDFCLLIVKYFKIGEIKRVCGTTKSFMTPKLWQENQNKKDYFTFKEGRDFFVKGDYSNVENVDYEIFKGSTDGVFFIHGVKDFDDELSHFEVMGY